MVRRLDCKDGYVQKDLPRSHFWEIYGQCTEFARVIKISQVLAFHFTTTFSGYLEPGRTSTMEVFYENT